MNFLSGSKMVFLEGRFDAGEVLRVIELERVTLWACVPTMLSRVLDHPDLAGTDTTSVRSLTVGGSTVPPELTARAAEALPNMARGMASVYGLTEAGGTVSAVSGSAKLEHPGTVGRPRPVVEVRLAATGDEDLDAKGGEILVRSPGVMLGYWGRRGRRDRGRRGRLAAHRRRRPARRGRLAVPGRPEEGHRDPGGGERRLRRRPRPNRRPAAHTAPAAAHTAPAGSHSRCTGCVRPPGLCGPAFCGRVRYRWSPRMAG